MVRLRPRDREYVFTSSEIETMEKLLKESEEMSLDVSFFQRLTRSFNSCGRAGRPFLRWSKVQNWYRNRQLQSPSKDNSLDGSIELDCEACPSAKSNLENDTYKLDPEACPLNKPNSLDGSNISETCLSGKPNSLDGSNKLNPEASPLDIPNSLDGSNKLDSEAGLPDKPISLDGSNELDYESYPLGKPTLDEFEELDPETCLLGKPNENTLSSEGVKKLDLSKLEFEARSSTDGAWYDVEKFLTCRSTESGETEALVRYLGFGSDEDEWVTVKGSIRERSLSLEDSDCGLLNPGDHVLCFQEQENTSKYYDAHVVRVKRRMHDARGCRCIFLIRYNHNNIEAITDSLKIIVFTQLICVKAQLFKIVASFVIRKELT